MITGDRSALAISRLAAVDQMRSAAYGAERMAPVDVASGALLPSAALERSALARALKRTADLVCAAVVLIATAPLSFAVAVLIKLEDGGPIIFRQVRTGRAGRPFTLRKFRSMRVDAEAETGPTWAAADDPRVTKVGYWIRALRIDEIPQVWNVLRGEMSFVGPRPERPEFVTILRAAIPHYEQRHTVRPGITGWAQVNLPYAATVEHAHRKLEYDLDYLRRVSLALDFFIMLRTFKIILFGWKSGRR